MAGLRQVNDTPSAIEAYTFRRILAGVDETPADSRERISALTKDDVIRVAQRVVLDTVYFMDGYGEDEYDE